MTEDRPAYEPDPSIQESASEVPQARLGSWTRLIKVFWAPSEVFEDIRRRPAWVLALIAIVLVGVLAQTVVVRHVDMQATVMEQMEKRNAEMTEEQMDRAVEMAERFKYVGAAAGVVVVPLVMALLAAIYLVSLRTTGGETDFKTTFFAMLHAYWPPGLTSAALTAVVLARVEKLPQQQLQHVVKSSLDALVAVDAPRWQHALAGSFDLFSLWTIVLLVTGFAIVARISKGRALVAVMVPWSAYILVKVGLAMLFGGM